MVRKPKFTRRGVILGSAALVLILAVALVGFGVLDGTSKGPIEARFVRFDRATNGYATRAILSLANRSGKVVGTFHTDAIGIVGCRFISPNPTGEVVWEHYLNRSAREFALRPHSQLEATTTMPEDGRAGRVSVVLRLQRPKPPAWLSSIRMQLHLKQPALTVERFVICDHVIQCPLVFPDGILQPPRLLSSPEATR